MIICMHCSDQSLPSQAVDSSEAEEHDKESRPSQDVVPSYKSSELMRERLLNYRQLLERMPMSTQQIFNPMKNQHQKTLEEHVESPTHHRIIHSTPSQLQESYDQRNSSRSGEMAQHLTADEKTVSKSGHSWTSYTRDDGQRPYDPFSPTEPQFYRSYQSQSQACDIDQDDRGHSYSQNMTEYTLPSVSVGTGRKWTVYDHASSSSAPQPQQSYQPRPADDGDFHSELSLSREVNWLDSWTSATGDTDLRNYRRHY